MITAMLAAISKDNQFSQDTPTQDSLIFPKLFHERILSRGARKPAIKAVVILQWVLYLTNPVRADRVTRGPYPITTEVEIQQLIEEIIKADVFNFLNQYMLNFQQSYAHEDAEKTAKDSSKKHTKGNIDYHQYRLEIHSEFQQYIVHELRIVSELVIRQLFGVLQSLKYKEEDYTSINNAEPMLDTVQADDAPVEANDAPVQTNSTPVQCRDFEHFLTFLTNVFTGPVDSGLIFWQRDGGLSHFVRWLLDIRVQATICAAFDFFLVQFPQA